MADPDPLPPICGLLPNSLLDWDGKISAVLFLDGCNFRCPWCHNPELVTATGAAIPLPEIIATLRRPGMWVDGVVVTGGEPLLHPGVGALCARLKAEGWGVKLDTNGSAPDRLGDLIANRLVDYVALDVKGGWSRYDAVSGVPGMGDRVRRALALLQAGGVPFEVRTTVVPGLVDEADFIELAAATGPVPRWVLQQYRPGPALDPAFAALTPYPAELIRGFGRPLAAVTDTVTYRNLDDEESRQ